MRLILDRPGTGHRKQREICMKSFQQRFYLQQRSLLKTLWRDLRMIAYILQVVYAWVVIGGRVRRAYRGCEQAGTTWWIDQLDREDF